MGDRKKDNKGKGKETEKEQKIRATCSERRFIIRNLAFYEILTTASNFAGSFSTT